MHRNELTSMWAGLEKKWDSSDITKIYCIFSLFFNWIPHHVLQQPSGLNLKVLTPKNKCCFQNLVSHEILSHECRVSCRWRWPVPYILSKRIANLFTSFLLLWTKMSEHLFDMIKEFLNLFTLESMCPNHSRS